MYISFTCSGLPCGTKDSVNIINIIKYYSVLYLKQLIIIFKYLFIYFLIFHLELKHEMGFKRR